MVTVDLSEELNHALETLVYLSEKDGLTRQDIVIRALDEYVRRHIYATEEDGRTVKIQRMADKPKARTGTRQSR